MRKKIADVESLLIREQRAQLPLPRQVLLYLDPFALFKDASSGAPRERERALSYNRAMRWMLVVYIRRWMAIAVALLVAVAPTDALAAQAKFFLIPAAVVGVGLSVATAVIVLTFAVYLLLGTGRE